MAEEEAGKKRGLEAVQTVQYSVFCVSADCSGTAGHAVPVVSQSQPTKW